MKTEEYITIKNVLSVKQPIGEFFVGIVKAKELLKVIHKNPRRYNEELDMYAGIQREIIPNKIRQLRKFIKTSDATFPNSIIATLNPNKFEFDRERSTLKIIKDPSSVAIIDGQHRLASFEGESEKGENFDLIVTFFLGLDLEEQAYLFSIINMTQKKLNPSLVRDLTELFTITTPEKLAHNLAKIFNSEKASPWYKKIKMLGKDIGIDRGALSQYTFTKGIVNLIVDTEKNYEIRDILKKFGNDRTKLNSLKVNQYKYVFWGLYVQENDNEIFRILEYYFRALKKEYPTEWGNKEYILTKTTGYNAFMRFLGDLFNVSKDGNIEMNARFFENYITSAKSKIEELNSANYPPGVQGENKLYKDLLETIK